MVLCSCFFLYCISFIKVSASFFYPFTIQPKLFSSFTTLDCQHFSLETCPELLRLWYLWGFGMLLCWSVIMPQQNRRPGQTMTSHRQKPSQRSHNKQLSVATLCLWSRSRDEICLLFPLFGFALFSFPYDFSLCLFFPSRWAGVLNEGTTPAALGCTLNSCLKRAFLSYLLSPPSPHLLYSILSFSYIPLHPFYFF